MVNLAVHGAHTPTPGFVAQAHSLLNQTANGVDPLRVKARSFDAVRPVYVQPTSVDILALDDFGRVEEM